MKRCKSILCFRKTNDRYCEKCAMKIYKKIMQEIIKY